MNHRMCTTLLLALTLLLAALPISAAPSGPAVYREGRVNPASSTNDPAGDGTGLTWLYPHPDWERDITIAANKMSVQLPTWIANNPASFYWYGSTEQPQEVGYNTVLDAAPDASRVAWTAGGTSSTADAVDGSLQPYEDITRLEVSQAGAKIQFEWQFRGDIPAGEPNVDYFFDFGDSAAEEHGE
jgi:hypothetical protein